jgi:tagaturonate reductase
VVTDDLERFERLKLFFLNAGHTYLAQRWLTDARAVDETVAQAMNDPLLRADLEALWTNEVLPIFQNLGHGVDALNYLTAVRERFINPFLAHKLADIAKNHDEKKQRRLRPIVTLAETRLPELKQPLLRSALANINQKNSE